MSTEVMMGPERKSETLSKTEQALSKVRERVQRKLGRVPAMKMPEI